MKRHLIDCGFIIGILEEDTDGKPMLTLVQPASDSDESQSMVIWDLEGLRMLREELAMYLDEWDAAQQTAFAGQRSTERGE